MTTEIFLKNIAYTFFYTTGDYLIVFMALFSLFVILAVLFDYLTN